MRIGFIENPIGDKYILFWFYKFHKKRWIRIREEKIPVGFRDVTLERIARSGALVPLGRGV